MLDDSTYIAPSQANAAIFETGMWQLLAMDFDGFYGTRIVVAAATRSEAVRRATAEAERFARASLAKTGFAYGMSATMAGIEDRIAERCAVFRAEAEARLEPLQGGAAILSAPGWRP